jgi:hypothetical protein
MNNESVGSLLAVIANFINDGLRVMMFADKRAWGPDEFEQLRLLEETLDEAKKDFQTLPGLVHGRGYYEHDRKGMLARPVYSSTLALPSTRTWQAVVSRPSCRLSRRMTSLRAEPTLTPGPRYNYTLSRQE